MSERKDVAVVLSGGGMSGVVMELGFLQRLRSSPLWERVGVVFGTSAGALAGCMAVLDRLGDRIGTDGSWVRNYPLGYAYERPEVELIVGFRYVPRYPVLGAGVLQSVIDRLRRYSRLPAARTLVAELQEAVDREERGLPAHIADIFSRLTRVAIIRNTQLEEVVADLRDQSVRGLRSRREEVHALVAEGGGPELAKAVDERFGSAQFPFRHDRAVPRITVVGTPNGLSLDPGFRNPKPWTEATN